MGRIVFVVMLILSILRVTEGDGDSVFVGKVQELLNRPFFPAAPYENISERCFSDSQKYVDELANNTLWALQMFDSSAKLQSGLGAGNLVNYGLYEQCLEAVGDGFRGLYCTASIKLDPLNGSQLWEALSVLMSADMRWQFMEKTMSWGLCVPSTCSESEVEAGLQGRLSPVDPQLRVRVSPRDCRDSTTLPLSTAERAILIFLVAVLLLVILATVYDMYTNIGDNSERKLNGLGMATIAFSLRANSRKLFDTRVRDGSMLCLNGIRVLSMVWIILLHKFLFVRKSPLINKLQFWHVLYDNSLMLLVNGSLSTDSFLLLSGLLLSYKFFKYIEKRSSFNIFNFYFCRYVRLTPPYAVVVFFYATLLYRMGDGPTWSKFVGTQRDLCVNGWWTNLLYVNNFLGGSKHMCMKPSWYLAVDMQLYLFSPLVLYPLWKSPRAGLTLLVMALAASIAIPIAIVTVYLLPGQMPLRLIGTNNIAEDMLYLRPFARSSPYLLGMAFGYWLNTIKDKDIVLPKWAAPAGWTCSLAVMAAALQGAQGIVLETHHVSTLESAAYAGFARFAWSCGLLWLVFACVYGYGGVVNSLLSASVLQPLSKLSYCIYLCHWMVLLWRTGSKTTSEYYSVYNMTTEVIGDFPFMLFMSTILCLAFEMPLVVLSNMVMSRGSTAAVQGASGEAAKRVTPQPPAAESLEMRDLSKDTVVGNSGQPQRRADRLV